MPADRFKSARNAVVAVFAAVVLASCASAGNEQLKDATKANVQERLKKGMTQAEVRQIYGDPATTSFTDSGQVIWKYAFEKAQARPVNFIPVVGLLAGGADGTKKELTILFDKNDRLQKHSMTESPVALNTGLLNQ